MKPYWLQLKAPAGNWYDHVGADDKGTLIGYGEAAEGRGETARVVERHDVEVWVSPRAQRRLAKPR